MSFTPDGRTVVSSGADGDVIAWDVERGELRETFSGHSEGGVNWPSPPTVARSTAPGPTVARSFGTSPATGGFSGRSTPGGRSRPTTAIGTRSSSRSARTVARWPGRTTTARSSSSTRERSNGATSCVRYAASPPRSTSLPTDAARGLRRGWPGDAVGRPYPAVGWAGAQRVADHLPGARLLTRRRATRRRRTRPAKQGVHGVQGWEGQGVGRSPTRPDWRGLPGDVAFGRFSPDGETLAAAGREHPSQIRDARSGELVAKLRTADWGRSVAFSPDGSLVATGDWAGRAQLWSTETWKPVGRPSRVKRRASSRWISPVTAVRSPPQARTGRSCSGTWIPARRLGRH